MKNNKISAFLGLITLLSLLSISAIAKDKILIASKEKGDFSKFKNSLVSELSEKFDLNFVDVNSVSYKEFEKKFLLVKPKALILMDNLSVSLAKELYTNTGTKVQSIAVMGLNLRKSLISNSNICGIAYEVPIYTLLTNYRATNNKSLKKVLVFYRSSEHRNSLKRERELLTKENIDLELLDVDKSEDTLKFMQEQAKLKIISPSEIDAVLVLLDSFLINRDLFVQFWLPTAEKSKIPFLVSTKSLVLPKLNFGLFGMSPNIPDLANQTKQMLESILEEGKSCSDLKVEDLIGVDSFWNNKKAKSLGLELNKSLDINILDGDD